MPIPANAPRYEDQSDWLDHPKSAKAVTSLASDYDLSILFPAGYAREIYIAAGETHNLTVLHAGDTVPVTYVAPASATTSCVLKGLFTVIKSTSTVAAANLIVRE